MIEERPYLRIPLGPPPEWLEKLEETNSDDQKEQESEDERVVIIQL